MKVQQVMTPAPSACGAEANLCQAVELMWKGDFGALPVTDEGGKVIGILTDRDIAMALGTRNRPACDVRVGDVMLKPVVTCRPDDDVETALHSMEERQIRRLPVVDAQERLCGLFSLNDAVLETGSGVDADAVVSTLHSISEHRKPSASPLVVAA